MAENAGSIPLFDHFRNVFPSRSASTFVAALLDIPRSGTSLGVCHVIFQQLLRTHGKRRTRLEEFTISQLKQGVFRKDLRKHLLILECRTVSVPLDRLKLYYIVQYIHGYVPAEKQYIHHRLPYIRVHSV